jgi:hypothetical protein
MKAETEHHEGWHHIRTAPKDGTFVLLSTGEPHNYAPGAFPFAIARYREYQTVVDARGNSLRHGWENQLGGEYCEPKWWQPLELPK